MSLSALARRALGLVRRSLWTVIVLVAALLLAWFRLWAPVRVQVSRVDRGLVVQEAFGRGTIESQREAAVGFDLVGRLSEVLVDEGARLETNQAQADFRSAQTGIAAARAQLTRLAAEEERARAMLATAEREFTRTQALVTSGAVLCDVRRRPGQTQIVFADLDVTRRQAFVFVQGSSVGVTTGTWNTLAPTSPTVQAALDAIDARGDGVGTLPPGPSRRTCTAALATARESPRR